MKNKFLWLPVLLLIGEAVSGQADQKFLTDPVAQLRQLVQKPQVNMPSLSMPTLANAPGKLPMPGYDIKKSIEKGMLLCPLLNARSTILLQGERKNDAEVGLEWKTTNTYLNSGSFDVERSFGDTMHFEKVNFVWAKGSRIKEKYTLPDNNDYNEISYYRIKMFLTDGSFRYSNIAPVKGYDKFLFSIYPNPSATQASLIVSSRVGGRSKISITDGEGKTVQQYYSSVAEGYNQKKLDVSRLPAGVYMLTVVLPDKQLRVKKIVKY